MMGDVAIGSGGVDRTEKVVRWLLIAAHAFRVVAGETSLRKWQPDGGGEMVLRRLRLVAL
jgi:hypothetical protein